MNFPETPSFSLKNKRALVTGAGRGIGLGASIALASAGADVMMVSRTAKELEKIYNHLKQLGHKSSYKSLDVTNQNDVSKLIEDEDCFDILVNNAGTNIPEPFEKIKQTSMNYLVDLNMKAAFNVAQLLVLKMLKNKKKGGSIINISSQLGHVGMSGRNVYNMTKFGIEGF